MSTQDPSPLAAPAPGTAPSPQPASAPPPAPVSAFASPAQTAPEPAMTAPGTVDMGDTSALDNVSSREPLVKPCTVPGKVNLLEVKTSSSGKTFISAAVQVFGDKMVFEDGQPVPPGKRLTTSIFLPTSTPENLERSERKLKNLLLALHDVPLDGKEKDIYRGWPPQQKIGVLRPTDGRPEPAFSLHAFQPTDKWVEAKVMVQVTAGKDIDGNPRNEFTLLAISTKLTERKGK